MLEKIRKKIIETSLEFRTKALIANIAIGIFLICTTAFLSLVGIKYDYDSNFLLQSKKLEILAKVQDIYSQILYEHLDQKNFKNSMEEIDESWNSLKEIPENYSLTIKDFYIRHFLTYGQKIEDLEKEEKLYNELIDRKILQTKMIEVTSGISVSELVRNAMEFNDLIGKAVAIKLKILETKKLATNSIFTTSVSIIIVLVLIITATTLFLSSLILSSIKKMHKSLEDLVWQKTKELRELNENLKESIRIEVEHSRKTDQILYQQSKMASMGEMLQNIAHQWRQPLNSLIILIQSFKLKAENGKLNKEFLEEQTSNGLRIAKNMSETIENFRNFFDPNKPRSIFSIKNSIDDSIEFCSASLGHRDINIHFDTNGVFDINGYKNAFIQVMINLINNARDAINDGMDKGILKRGFIDISLCEGQDCILVEVKDNANGIKDENLEKIFEPYFTTKHKSVGTGVGLYMVKQIIEKQMYGKISVTNVEWTSKMSAEILFGALFLIEIPIGDLK